MEIKPSPKVFVSDSLRWFALMLLCFGLLLPIVGFLQNEDFNPTLPHFIEFYKMVSPVLFTMCFIFSSLLPLGYLAEKRRSLLLTESGITFRGILREKKVDWTDIQNLIFKKSFRGGQVTIIKKNYNDGPKLNFIEKSHYEFAFEMFLVRTKQ